MLGARQGLLSELIPFAVALIVAQTFFTWGSFSLELFGFLTLWWGTGYLYSRLRKLIS